MSGRSEQMPFSLGFEYFTIVAHLKVTHDRLHIWISIFTDKNWINPDWYSSSSIKNPKAHPPSWVTKQSLYQYVPKPLTPHPNPQPNIYHIEPKPKFHQTHSCSPTMLVAFHLQFKGMSPPSNRRLAQKARSKVHAWSVFHWLTIFKSHS